jgi:hypothetical protein
MSATDRTRPPSPPPAALVVGGTGPAIAVVRQALADAGFAERIRSATGSGWTDGEPADLVVLDAAEVDVVTALAAVAQSDPRVPIVVAAGEEVDAEERRAWLRAGAWEVVYPRADAEALALFFSNVVRGRPPPPDRPPKPDDPAHYRAGYRKDPYAWRPLCRVVEETLALTRRHGRPLACIAFLPEWGEPGTASAPVLLADRLARTLLPHVRGDDLVGITEHGAVLAVLPETTSDGAHVIQLRMLELLRGEVRALGMVTGIRTAMAHVGDHDEVASESAARFLLRAVARAS